MRWMILGSLFLMACEVEGSDVATGDPDERPDIQGTYTVFAPIQVEGCDDRDVSFAWLEAGLEIEGEAAALTFAFAGGEILAGDVDSAFTFTASGTVGVAASEWDVSLEGLAFIGDETWQLDGDIDAEITDSTAATPTCTLTGRLEAEQNPP